MSESETMPDHRCADHSTSRVGECAICALAAKNAELEAKAERDRRTIEKLQEGNRRLAKYRKGIGEFYPLVAKGGGIMDRMIAAEEEVERLRDENRAMERELDNIFCDWVDQ